METHSRTNLIINYLPQTLTDEEFNSMFMSIGPLKASKIVRDRATSYSYGFGFVEFQKEEDAQKAVNTLNGLQLQNKRIKVAPARVGESVKGANLYIRNLPRTLSQEDFETMFAEYGTVVQSRLLKDQATGKSKGVGFVLFEAKYQADAAIESLDGQVPEGGTEVLSVAFADDNKGKARPPHPFGPGGRGGYSAGGYQGRGGYQGQGDGGYQDHGNGGYGAQNYHGQAGRGGMMGGQGGGYHSGGGGYAAGGGQAVGGGPGYYSEGGAMGGGGYGPGPMRNQNQNRFRYNPMGGGAQGGQAASNSEGFVLFAYNIGAQTTEGELWQLFSPFGAVLKVNVIRDFQKDQGKGYGFVTMATYQDSMEAIKSLNGYAYADSKPLQVSFKTTSK